jgi:hypothetical protein
MDPLHEYCITTFDRGIKVRPLVFGEAIALRRRAYLTIPQLFMNSAAAR